MNRRKFLQSSMAISVAASVEARAALPAKRFVFTNRKLGTIYNNDPDNLLYGCLANGQVLASDFRAAVGFMLDGKIQVLAQEVGLPDPVLYPTKVGTTWDKYLAEVSRKTWPNSPDDTLGSALAKFLAAGHDPLALTIEVCRKRGVAFVAAYRMNAEDWYQNTWELSEFGRAHPDWRIPNTGALDPAVPEVYEERMKIFTEVAEKYDIDGIEFNYRRWTHMISNPLENHRILTRMVRETRQMLNTVAQRKGRQRLLLGVRVGPSLADSPGTEYSGGNVKNDISCRELGLDVKTWIDEELVDYVAPCLFWPRWPGLPKTPKFVALTKNKNVGVYPTLFPIPKWIDEGPIAKDDVARRLRYRGELGAIALQCFQEGAHGLSTFNWVQHHQPAMVKSPLRKEWGVGCLKEQMAILPHFRSEAALREYLHLT